MAIGRITGQMLSSTLNRESTNLKFSTAGETNLLFLDASNDRVGIATASPAYTLDVTGTARVTSNLRIEGNLDVQGTQTTFETANVAVEDPLLELNRNGSGADIDAGIFINRGSNNAAAFYFNEGTDKFHAVTTASGANATSVTDTAYQDIVSGGLDIATDASSNALEISQSSGDAKITAATADKDVIFEVTDGGTGAYEVFRVQNNSGSGIVKLVSGASLQFADSGESISGDGSDLTIASGGVINLNATTTISANSKRITNIADPSGDQDAATKGYVTAQISAGADNITEGDSKVEVVDAGDSTQAVVNVVINDKTIATFGEENDGKSNISLGGIDFNDNVISTQSNADIDLQANGTGKVTITSDTGLTVGAGDDFAVTVSSDDVLLTQATADKDIIFQATDGGTGTFEVFRVLPESGAGAIKLVSSASLQFADSGEKISGDGTDLTINSGADINLTATADVNLPSNVGLTFGSDAFKIEANGTDLTLSSSNNVAVSGNMTVSGDLQVSGTTTYIDTTNLLVEDPLILLSKNNSGGADVDAGILIERGSAGNNAAFYWNEGDDTFKAVTTTSGHDATTVTDTALAGIIAGKLTADNLELDGNTITASTGNIILGSDVDTSGQRIVTTESNADILLDPSGTGTVNVVGAIVSNVGTPSASTDAATKGYVDTEVSNAKPSKIVNLDSEVRVEDGTGITVTLDSTEIAQFRTDIALDLGAASDAIVIPKGNTAARPTAETGLLRFNSETGELETCRDGSTFENIAVVSAETPPIVKDTATGDGSTTSFASFFTTAPADENNVIVVVDNVIQQPDVNYTISGTTLTFDQAPHSGAAIFALAGFDNGSTVAPAFTALNSDLIPAQNNTYDVGSSSKKWKEGFFVTVSATYADVAERYAADTEITAGTVVQLGGAQEVTVTSDEATDEVFGVVSARPGFGLNKEAGTDQTHPWIAQVGRVDVKVKGTVNKGDRLIASSTPGIARAATKAECTAFNVIGRALETKTTSGVGLVLTSVRVSH